MAWNKIPRYSKKVVYVTMGNPHPSS